MTNYTILKLVTGEEIIAELDSSSEDFINISSPYSINYISTPTGGYGIKIVPYLPCSVPSLFTIRSRSIILMTEPLDEVMAHYFHARDFYENMSRDSEPHDEISDAKLVYH